MSNIKLINKIKSGEVKMKPKWQFVIKNWCEVGLWIGSIGLVVAASLSIAYFVTMYDPRFLMEFGDLGWKLFYEDFPYIWGAIGIFCMIAGFLVMIKSGDSYKRSWQKNLMIMSAIILILTIVSLFLRR